MATSGGRSNTQAMVRRVRIRFAYAIAAANAAGALEVFLFLSFVLPNPSGTPHATRLLIINAATFVIAMPIGFTIAWGWSYRRWQAAVGWASLGREPTERERELTLRFPLSQQGINATLWGLAAVVFTAVNAPFTLEGAGNAAITIVLGGLVTCALGYLLGERIMRPLAALCLAAGFPRRPQLPGVAARALLSWTLGTGVVLIGLALVGVGGLHDPGFTATRLSVVILVLSALGLVVGLSMTIGLAHSVSDRIEALRKAVGRVEQGDLEHELEVDDGSELGLLQAGFNQMLDGLREREQIRDLFGRQVGEDVVRHALEHGVDFDGEAREAAVLFVDLQGSTALAEERDPAEVVALLNRFFAIVVEVVAECDGWVNKFEGDAALCVFGAPLADQAAADHALAAARRLASRLDAELSTLRAGIGVSAGRVVAGNIGAASRFEYTVIGDPVNEAARLTELAKGTAERVLASEAALARADAAEAARWERRDEVKLRGRSSLTTVATPA